MVSIYRRFGDIRLYQTVSIYRRFGGTQSFYLEVRLVHATFFDWWPWIRKQFRPSERRQLLTNRYSL